MKIGNWTCSELCTGEPYQSREAVCGNVVVTADADGLEVSEGCIAYAGSSGINHVPANVLVWLCAVVR